MKKLFSALPLLISSTFAYAQTEIHNLECTLLALDPKRTSFKLELIRDAPYSFKGIITSLGANGGQVMNTQLTTEIDDGKIIKLHTGQEQAGIAYTIEIEGGWLEARPYGNVEGAGIESHAGQCEFNV